MANDKRIPIAYVTKWATTRGILVIRDGGVSEGGYLYCGFISVPQSHWTEDRAVAEGRWRKAMQKAADLAQKKADRLRSAVALSPKYTER
jgi:hypothetical protein